MANIYSVPPPNVPPGRGSGGPGKSRSSALRKTEISDAEAAAAGLLAEKLRQSGGVRPEVIRRVREQIAAGTFETPERIEATVDRLMEELFPDL